MRDIQLTELTTTISTNSLILNDSNFHSVKNALATNLPQAVTDRVRQLRVSAGSSGLGICGKNLLKMAFMKTRWSLSH